MKISKRKLAEIIESKGATGKLPSYMRKGLPNSYKKKFLNKKSAAEKILFE